MGWGTEPAGFTVPPGSRAACTGSAGLPVAHGPRDLSQGISLLADQKPFTPPTWHNLPSHPLNFWACPSHAPVPSLEFFTPSLLASDYAHICTTHLQPDMRYHIAPQPCWEPSSEHTRTPAPAARLPSVSAVAARAARSLPIHAPSCFQLAPHQVTLIWL